MAAAVASARRPIAARPRFVARLVAPLGTRQPVVPPRNELPPARLASALLLLYPGEGGEPTIPLTKRRADLRHHPGEVSLPGGAVDPIDSSREATALREAFEEIGLDRGAVDIVGTLDDVWIPVSNFELRPFVATAKTRPALSPAAAEVAAVIELPLRQILSEAIVEEDEIPVRGGLVRTAVYRHSGERIWGATARVLSMLVAVLEEAGLTD